MQVFYHYDVSNFSIMFNVSISKCRIHIRYTRNGWKSAYAHVPDVIDDEQSEGCGENSDAGALIAGEHLTRQHP